MCSTISHVHCYWYLTLAATAALLPALRCHSSTRHICSALQQWMHLIMNERTATQELLHGKATKQTSSGGEKADNWPARCR